VATPQNPKVYRKHHQKCRNQPPADITVEKHVGHGKARQRGIFTLEDRAAAPLFSRVAATLACRFPARRFRHSAPEPQDEQGG
jgi:hypothetical protein